MSDRSKKQIPVVQTASPASGLPSEFQHLLEWLGTGVERMEAIEDEKTREEVFALLEGIDILHRQGIGRIMDLIGGQQAVERISQDPIVHTLLEMYDLPEADERTQVERALEDVYPYFQSHGGKLEILGVEDGRVRVRLSGSCEGCPGTATTLSRVVEEALREGFPGFRELVAEEPPPPPPRNDIVQLGRRPMRRPRWVSAGWLKDLEPGTLQGRRLEGAPLLLTILEGEVYAYRDGCPPGSALTLQLGRVEGMTLVCPWHGCRYDLRTGKREDAEGKLSVLPVAVRDGEVKVALGTEEVGPG
ncbi:MAG: NifU family protein [Rubrobacter sp.]|jgi:Fe-S cluster biogenesis protein NfuA/nitrite reductase/ring-hydroxylating ferredoxin subunit|nr:NifU family protein [Rubrobacter sp.]